MALRGYDFVVQDRTGSKFTIGNLTLFRASKLACSWHDDRSRVLITAFHLLADVHASRDGGDAAAAAAAVAAAGAAASAAEDAGAATAETAAANTEAAAARAAAVVDDGGAVARGEAAEVLVANCHLEGNPWKAQARFNQIRKAVAHMQRHVEAERRPVDDARILITGAAHAWPCSSDGTPSAHTTTHARLT